MATYGRPGVYVNERLLPAPITVLGTANAAGACIGNFAQGTTNVTLVTSWYDFVKKFGGYNSSYPATFGVGQFFNNGGSELYVRRVLGADTAAATAGLPEATTGNVATVTAKGEGTEGNLLRVELRATARADYYDFIVLQETATSATDASDSNDIILEAYRDVLINDALSSDFISTVVNLTSQYVTVAVTNGEGTPDFTRVALTGGDNGDAPTSAEYIAAISDFSSIDRPLVVFAPEIMTALDPADAEDVHAALASWAGSNNGFAVLDTEQAVDTAGAANLSIDAALSYATAITATSNAAVYYPNVYISDPLGRSPQSLRKVGPAGGVAGLYIFTDKQTGPFKAPAGLRANLRGAVALERSFTSAELDQLNSGTKADGTVVAPVNAVRNVPGAGLVVMGARTLLQDGTANKYVNTRRSLIFLRKSLKDLTEFALFENNDERLWGRIRTVLSVFLTDYWNQGGLRGTNTSQAFFIKCDAENNSNDSIANGEVHIEVGVALQYPAEFVVITLSQKTAN